MTDLIHRSVFWLSSGLHQTLNCPDFFQYVSGSASSLSVESSCKRTSFQTRDNAICRSVSLCRHGTCPAWNEMNLCETLVTENVKQVGAHVWSLHDDAPSLSWTAVGQ
uniref:Uncharacterized protein n=1 Tax=Knipowitschia caucasica TaxID=637954 RepID=A0AAV2MD11_KNICA